MTMTSLLMPLVLTDRCDRCGAQAFVRAIMPHGSLLFCAHDWRKNEEAIRKVSTQIQDERARLYEHYGKEE